MTALRDELTPKINFDMTWDRILEPGVRWDIQWNVSKLPKYSKKEERRAPTAAMFVSDVIEPDRFKVDPHLSAPCQCRPCCVLQRNTVTPIVNRTIPTRPAHWTDTERTRNWQMWLTVSRNVPDLHSRGSQFEFRSEYQTLNGRFPWFSSMPSEKRHYQLLLNPQLIIIISFTHTTLYNFSTWNTTQKRVNGLNCFNKLHEQIVTVRDIWQSLYCHPTSHSVCCCSV